MNEPILNDKILLLGYVFNINDVYFAIILLLVLSAVLLFILIWKISKNQQSSTSVEEEIEEKFNKLAMTQSETSAKISTLTEIFSTRQVETAKFLNERMDGMSEKLSKHLVDGVRYTAERLEQLNIKMASLDQAQNTMKSLTDEVSTLKAVLSNKQSRGAFGQARLEMILNDALPKDLFSLQPTLSNSKRPDAVIFMPSTNLKLAIDAKFPLEAITSFIDAETEQGQKEAARRIRTDLMKHVDDIHTRYFIPGETLDIAIMFLPSEMVYATLHESFDDVLQKSYRKGVMIVSPQIMMLAVETIRLLFRDARITEEAKVLQEEVLNLAKDVAQLMEVATKFNNHFNQTQGDIERMIKILQRLNKRSNKVTSLDIEDPKSPQLFFNND